MTAIQLSNKRKFNIDSNVDIEIFKYFLVNRDWRITGTCPFELEYPYLNVPDMIKDKLIHKFLKVEKT
jgi:hypothetical protein